MWNRGKAKGISTLSNVHEVGEHAFQIRCKLHHIYTQKLLIRCKTAKLISYKIFLWKENRLDLSLFVNCSLMLVDFGDKSIYNLSAADIFHGKWKTNSTTLLRKRYLSIEWLFIGFVCAEDTNVAEQILLPRRTIQFSNGRKSFHK